MAHSFAIRRLPQSRHEEAALLLHRSLKTWYEKHLRQGYRFGDSARPFLLFPEMYAALDPGEELAAFDTSNRLVGICFVHPRETHVAVGILATDPDFVGKGIAKTLMQSALDRARRDQKPLRLVSSLLNLDSFSLYSRLGLVPHTIYQDIALSVPKDGIAVSAPPHSDRIRLARPQESEVIAELEFSLQGIRRAKDYAFFLANPSGSWKVWVSETPSGSLNGVLASSHNADWGMIGPGVAENENVAASLAWRALDARRGLDSVILVPSTASGLVRTLYKWGGRNIELHAAQSIPPAGPAHGVAFPTFLPESA